MNFILLGIILILAAALILISLRVSGMMEHLDRMLEEVLNHRFVEGSFNEEKMSRIETKMFRYLVLQERSRDRLSMEKDTIKSLVSDISHQTKTPIANILLYTQLLMEEGKKDEGVMAILDQIEGQTQKLNFLISALVKLSRLENGIVSLKPVPSSICVLQTDMEYEKAAARKKINLTWKEFPDITAVFDTKWTREALANILDNAIKYTPRGGRITVSATEYEMFVRIDIRDTGIGLTETETAQIFTRFYRSPRVSEENGVGIGLYLSREILSRQSGYIKVSSELDKGSLFSVFLPKQATLSKL